MIQYFRLLVVAYLHPKPQNLTKCFGEEDMELDFTTNAAMQLRTLKKNQRMKDFSVILPVFQSLKETTKSPMNKL